MKKFSNITNQKINEEPKEVNKVDEADVFKHKVRSLIDQFLRIRSNGSVDNRYRAGSVTIEGKELLVEAILDLLSDDKKNEQIKLLESLKTEVKDWQAIDNKIESLNKEKTLISNRNKFKSLLENYTDNDLLVKVVENDSVKINKEKTLRDYIELTKESNLESNVKNNLVKIWSDRLNQLRDSE